MGWQSVVDRAKGTEYEASSSQLVQKLETQLQAIESFLQESRQSAATDPALAAMRGKIEESYNQAQATLAYLGQDDNMDRLSTFQNMGAIASVSYGLDLVVDPNDRGGITAIKDYERAVDVPNEDGAKELTGDEERAAYIAERRSRFAARIDEFTHESVLKSQMSEASAEHWKARADANYTPDSNRSFQAIAADGVAGERLASLNRSPGHIVSLKPADRDALAMYNALDSLRQTVPYSLSTMSPELRDEVANINMNVIARAYAGEYGETFKLRPGTDRDIHAGAGNFEPGRMDFDIGRMAGVTSNPLQPYFMYDVQGGLKDEYAMPGRTQDYYAEFFNEGLPRDDNALSAASGEMLRRVENSGGERIPSEQIYAAMGLNESGPDFSGPSASTDRRIHEDIARIESNVALLEELVAAPTAKDFQQTLTEHNTSIDAVMMSLKENIGNNRYGADIAGQTYQRLYDNANFDQRVEALLGVPIRQSQTMRYESSPLLQALSRNFETFHPTPAGQTAIPEMRDGTTQLGEALAARHGAVLLDNHAKIDSTQFLHDSLPEIASRGSAKILIENAGNMSVTTGAGGLIVFGQKDPIEQYYEDGNAEHLRGLKSSFTDQLERIAQTRDLTPAEQAQLTELQQRDALFAQTIEEAYTQYGIRFEFYGGGLENRIADNFGLETRAVTTNYDWDNQFRQAAQGVDNLIILGGGAHFVDNTPGINSGRMVLDESLGYPTFAAGNTEGLFHGDYNVTPSATVDGRWTSSTEPPAPATTHDPRPDLKAEPVAPR